MKTKMLILFCLSALMSSCTTMKDPAFWQAVERGLQDAATASLLTGCLQTTGGDYGYNPYAYRETPNHSTYAVPSFGQSESSASIGALGVNRYDPNSLANPYGAGSPYKTDGLMNPYSQYGSRYSNKSWQNPYATDAPKLYDSRGNYRGKLSANQYDPDSTSNPYGRYGSKHSADSINNPYGAGNPYSGNPIYVVPSK